MSRRGGADRETEDIIDRSFGEDIMICAGERHVTANVITGLSPIVMYRKDDFYLGAVPA